MAVPSPKRRSPPELRFETLVPSVLPPARKSALPAVDGDAGRQRAEFRATAKSLMRPPQPVAPPLGSELCHCCV